MVERINLLLKAKNITAKQFAEEIGIQPSGMSHILSGRNNPSLDFVMKVVKRWPEINIHWLMFGKGEMFDGAPLGVYREVESTNQTVQASTSPEQFDLFSPIEPIANNRLSVPENTQTPNSPDTTAHIVATDRIEAVQSANIIEAVANPQASQGVQSHNQTKESPSPQPVENRINETAPTPTSFKTNLRPKKITKIIVFFEDHSFSEYFPE